MPLQGMVSLVAPLKRLMLYVSLLAALFRGISSQDLFVSNPSLPQNTAERVVSYSDGDWESMVKTTRESLLDKDPQLRGYIQQLKNKESRLDTSDSSASADPRRLPSDDGKPHFIVNVLVFGEMGQDEPRPYEERLEEAQQWMFIVISKSMTSGRVASDTIVDIESLTDDEPEFAYHVIEPYELDARFPQDQRSPMKRTRFTFTLTGLSYDNSRQFASNFCGDYKDMEDILLQGIMRALENADMYPGQGFNAAKNLGAGLGSFLHVEAKVVSSQGENRGDTLFGCEETVQPKPTSVHGMFFLPECPENSKRCSDRPELCTKDERRHQGWMCKCLFGYTDTPPIGKKLQPGWGNIDALLENLHYDGECVMIKKYCPLTNSQDEVMESDDAVAALGVIGESASPKCDYGYFSTGTAKCMGVTARTGAWQPHRWCKFAPPKEPPVPHCEDLARTDSSIPEKCGHCKAGDPNCPCKVKCSSEHKQVSGPEDGNVKCLDVDFTPQCPQANELNWLGNSKPEGKRCRHNAHAFVHDFCCDGAWGPNKPQELQAIEKCTQLTKDDACLSHYQADSESPCCWNDHGYSADSAEKLIRCVARGDNMHIIDSDPLTYPEACAVRPHIPRAVWDQENFPQCKAVCENIYSQQWSLTASAGCANCVPGESSDTCDCTVTCKAEDLGFPKLIWIGGGSEGKKTCKSTTGAFEAAPVCWPIEPTPICSRVPESDEYNMVGCRSALAISDANPHAEGFCHVECDNLYKLVGSVIEGRKFCREQRKPLKSANCESIEERTECINARELEHHGPDGRPTPTSNSPCCWQSGVLGFPRCVPKGSNLMSIDSPPLKCADEKMAVWDPFPQCEKKCVNIFIGVQNVEEKVPRTCDDCIASAPGSCHCNVRCVRDTNHIGGEPEGPRKCLAGLTEPFFKSPPVCAPPGGDDGVKIYDPDPPICTVPTDPGLKIQGCRRCTAGAGCADGCSVECASRYLLLGGKETEKQCRWEPVSSVQERPCSDAGDSREACLNSKQGEEPCCYFDDGIAGTGDGPHCAVKGDTRIKVLPKKCTDMKEQRWDDMPICARQCEHQFEGVPNIEWDKDRCSECSVGGECHCSVTCTHDMDHIGGGSEDHRKCPSHEMLGLAEFQMEDPPVCAPRPRTPKCDASQFPPGIRHTDCEGCVANQPCPACRIECDQGYKKVGGLENAPMKCIQVLHSKINPVPNCEAISGYTACIFSYQSASTSDRDFDRPCCYRADGFSTQAGTVFCTAIKSPKITFNNRPDQCTTMHEGKWEFLLDPLHPPPTMLQCKPKCPNIFIDAVNIDQALVIEACEDCIVDEECSCNVQCVSGTFALPSQPAWKAPGKRPCLKDPLLSSGLPYFNPPPRCEPKCQIPSHEKGTLSLADCKEACFPGGTVPCNCRISCARGVEWSGGGRPFEPLRCERTSYVSARFENLPICTPLCEPPDDQFQTMDTSRCMSRCKPDDPNCKCELRCYGLPMVDPGVGQVGEKICMFFPGDENTPAKARWVNPDRSTVGWDKLPGCMAPLYVLVVDATNHEPLDRTRVRLSDQEHMELMPDEKFSNAKGQLVFHTTLLHLAFEVFKEGYSLHHLKIDRRKQCGENPARCFIQFNINKKLPGGHIHPDGCYFTARPGRKVDWQMRAILSWNAKPADLDIWVRNADCAEDARIRYECWDEGDRLMTKGELADARACQRSQFTRPEVRDSEEQACSVRSCKLKLNPQRTESKSDGSPDCDTVFENQFTKWVMWATPYVTKLAHYIDGRVGRKIPGLEGWTDDNFMVLDTDARNGKGPETVTFHNVPPGTYQFAVHQFSKEQEFPNIKTAMPYIELFIGGNDVNVICKIEESCQTSSHYWNAFNIVISKEKGLTAEGEDKYLVRIVDEKEMMQKLHPKNVPTGDNRATFTWADTQEEYYGQVGGNVRFNELCNTCWGKCEVVTKGFESCISSV